jgi:hypothetical protein
MGFWFLALHQYSVLQESGVCGSVFLRFGIPVFGVL